MSVVRIRRANSSHAGEIFRLIDSGREHLSEWLPWVDEMISESEIREFLRMHAKLDFYSGREVYEIRDDGRFAGVIDLYNGNIEERSAHIGYWLGSEFMGRGIMTEACRKLLDRIFSRTSLQKLCIRVASGNTRSLGVPLRLGFRYSGKDKATQKIRGRDWELHVYSITKEEWLEKRSA